MRASFFICIAGIAAYLCVLFFYCMKISAKKKCHEKRRQENSKSQRIVCKQFASLRSC